FHAARLAHCSIGNRTRAVGTQPTKSSIRSCETLTTQARSGFRDEGGDPYISKGRKLNDSAQAVCDDRPNQRSARSVGGLCSSQETAAQRNTTRRRTALGR